MAAFLVDIFKVCLALSLHFLMHCVIMVIWLSDLCDKGIQKGTEKALTELRNSVARLKKHFASVFFPQPAHRVFENP